MNLKEAIKRAENGCLTYQGSNQNGVVTHVVKINDKWFFINEILYTNRRDFYPSFEEIDYNTARFALTKTYS